MVTVFDVAKYILIKLGSMSTWKLQKLCYYSQAWSLAWTGKPLFNEEFQAWANGPVCPALFNEHRHRFYVDETSINGNANALDSDQKDTVDTVLNSYGGMEPYELRELTHQEKPWLQARGNVPEGESCTTVISMESMGRFYGSL